MKVFYAVGGTLVAILILHACGVFGGVIGGALDMMLGPPGRHTVVTDARPYDRALLGEQCGVPALQANGDYRLGATSYRMDTGPRHQGDLLCGNGRRAYWRSN